LYLKLRDGFYLTIHIGNTSTNKLLGQSYLTINKVQVNTEQFSCGASYTSDGTLRCPLSTASEINIVTAGNHTLIFTYRLFWNMFIARVPGED